jgi:ribosome-associated heat shock protein Hsp15
MTLDDSKTPVRIDKWLWAARFYKTRSLAAEAVSAGHIDVNGQRSKASRSVALGEVIEIHKPPYRYTITVTQVTDRRGSGVQAQAMYIEDVASIATRAVQRDQQKLLGSATSPRPQKRPDKHDRRKLKEWRGK